MNAMQISTQSQVSRAIGGNVSVAAGTMVAPQPTRSIAAGGQLRRDAETALVTRAQSGDRQALEALIEANCRLITKVARRYRCRSYSREDLIQEGILGLILAIERFDTTRGFRLSTYAMHWVRQSIARAVEQNDRLIHVPMHATSDVRRLVKARDEKVSASGRQPSECELADLTGLGEERVADLLRSAGEVLSLEVSIGTESDANLLELAEDPNAVNPEQDALRGAYRQQVRMLVDSLRPRERAVLESRYGLDGRNPSTLDDLSREMCISRERVRQIEAQAMRKLRHALRSVEWA